MAQHDLTMMTRLTGAGEVRRVSLVMVRTQDIEEGEGGEGGEEPPPHMEKTSMLGIQ